MTLFEKDRESGRGAGTEGEPQEEVRVRRHMSTTAVATAIGTLAAAIGVSTWWGFGTAGRILQTQVEETGRQAAVTAGRSLESLQAASAANISRSADIVLDEPLRAQAAMAALLVETAEAAGRSAGYINGALNEIADEAGTGRIDAVAERGRSYSSEGTQAYQAIEARFRDLSDSVMDGAIRTASMPGVPEAGGLRKVAAAGTTHRPMIVRAETILDTEAMAADYGREADRWGRTLAEAQARSIALTAIHLFERAEEAGWSEQQVESRLDEIVESTGISLLLARTDQGGIPYEVGERHWAGDVAQRQHQTARRELSAAGEGSVTLLGHLNAERRWVVAAMATREEGNLTSTVNVVTQATNRGLLETGWQLEAERLATMEGIEGVWVTVLEDEGEARLAAAAPRETAGDEEAEPPAPATGEDGEPVDTSTWGRWTAEHEAQAREAAAAGGALANADVSLLRQERARVLSAAPAGALQEQTAVVVVQQEAADAAGQMRDEVVLGLGIAGLLLGVIGGGTAWGTRRWLTQPIEGMAEASRKLTLGKEPDAGLLRRLRRRNDEMGALARNFSEMIVQVRERHTELEARVAERTELTEAANTTLRRREADRRKDLELAGKVQQSLVSVGARRYGPVRMASRMTPARELGGDFVSILDRADGSVFIAVCDVSGKGIGAALFMAAAQSALSAAASRGAAPSEIAEETNRRLQEGNDLEMYVTGFVGVIAPMTGQLEYVCAGHEPPISIQSGDKAGKLNGSEDVPLGLGSPRERYTTRKRQLRAGETLVAYTDGIPDACNDEQREYGEARLQALVESNAGREPEELINEIWKAVDVFTGRAPTNDDKTVLILQREARPSRRERGQGRRGSARTEDAEAAGEAA